MTKYTISTSAVSLPTPKLALLVSLAVGSILAARPCDTFIPAQRFSRENWLLSKKCERPLFYSTLDESSSSSSWIPPPFADGDLDNDDGHPNHPKSSPPRGLKPLVTVVESTTAFADFLLNDDRIAVVEFHASWCKACQKFGLLYTRLANEMADLHKEGGDLVREGPIKMASLEWDKNKALVRALGITRLPSVQFYHNGKMLNSFSCEPKYFRRVEEEIQKYLQMTNKNGP